MSGYLQAFAYFDDIIIPRNFGLKCLMLNVSQFIKKFNDSISFRRYQLGV